MKYANIAIFMLNFSIFSKFLRKFVGMINLNKSLSADCRYTPGVVYIRTPEAAYGYRVKEALELFPGGCGIAPEVRVSVEEGDTELTLSARRLNVRNRFTGAVQHMRISLPVSDEHLSDCVHAFASEWYDLENQIVGDLEIDNVDNVRRNAPDPQAALVIFYVIKFKRMAPMQVLQLIQGEPLSPGKLSHIEIDTDTRIRLPELLDKPLGLNPLQRTVYILFLRHPEGIVLRLISDYTRELEEIYQVVKCTSDAERTRQAIANLCDPIDGTLHQQLSRIKQRILKLLPNKKLADAYSIQGKHSGPYAIAALSSGEAEFEAPKWLRSIPFTR